MSLPTLGSHAIGSSKLETSNETLSFFKSTVVLGCFFFFPNTNETKSPGAKLTGVAFLDAQALAPFFFSFSMLSSEPLEQMGQK